MNLGELLTPVNEAACSFERRLIVLAGREGEEIAPRLVAEYCRLRKGEEVNALYVSEVNARGLERLAKFKNLVEELRNFKLQNSLFKDSLKVLGSTFDLLILDLNENLTPNDIGVLVEVVRGGGLILFLTPKLSEWEGSVTSFHRRLVTLPEDYGRLRHLFIKWFVKKLKEHEGIWVYDPPNPINGRPLKPAPEARGEVKPPGNPLFPKELYELCATQDQVQALSRFERFLEKRKRKALVMIANRGRGKSSVLGLAAAGLVYSLGERRPFSVRLTAPSFSNLRPVLRFAKAGLEKLGVEVKGVEVKGEVVALRCGRGIIDASSPYRILERKGEIALIDEAAGIPVPLLFKILKKFRLTAFSSTIHGYEGAGRGFGLRFLKALEESRSIETIKLELKTPIRYSVNDPIEKWLYDALLLNAEPPPIPRSVDPKETIYERPNLEEWFTFNERPLREFVGICVLAHYRNRPNDFAMLADAPHHQARLLKLPSGEVVAALHLAEEGELPDEFINRVAGGENPPGAVVPSCVIKHYTPLKFFAKQRGLRIVRIAVHPELEGRGLGSKALKHLTEEGEAAGYDWIGAGFGATISLLNFWLKNEFIPIHLSPSRNATSGEYSAIVVKPLTRRASKLVATINQEFKLKMLNSLFSTYFTLDPKLARLLFKGSKEPKLFRPRLTKVQRRRLSSYANGVLTYEAAADSVKALVDAHFMSGDPVRVEIDPNVEAALVAKCLQGKNWSLTAKLSSISQEEVKTTLRETIGRMIAHYVEEN